MKWTLSVSVQKIKKNACEAKVVVFFQKRETKFKIGNDLERPDDGMLEQ